MTSSSFQKTGKAQCSNGYSVCPSANVVTLTVLADHSSAINMSTAAANVGVHQQPLLRDCKLVSAIVHGLGSSNISRSTTGDTARKPSSREGSCRPPCIWHKPGYRGPKALSRWGVPSPRFWCHTLGGACDERCAAKRSHLWAIFYAISSDLGAVRSTPASQLKPCAHAFDRQLSDRFIG